MTRGPGPRICIYTADTEPLCDAALFQDAYGAVSPERRAKTDKLRFEADKRLSLGAELLLMRACRDFGIRYEAERITENAYQKPGFASGAAEFNLSHSGTKVMCVMSEIPVGCDTEKLGNADTEIAKRFFHAEEYAALLAEKTDGVRRDLFFRLWTLKESYIKCIGRGFCLPLNEFCVSVTPAGATLVRSVDGSGCRFFEHDPGDGYKYACCARLPEPDAPCPEPVWQRLVCCKAFLNDLRE